jgi:3-phosphoshikimate 1-carboxyvinyltransferase
MTLDVLKASGVEVSSTPSGYAVRGPQRYRLPAGTEAEADWSGAAFWLAMNHLGSAVAVEGLNPHSRQPDRVAGALLAQVGGEKDMAQCPDLFPALAAAAAADDTVTTFTSMRRLRLKESDRVAAMAAMLAALGVATEEAGDRFIVKGIGRPFAGGCRVATFGDHRIAMAAAVAASHALAPVEIDNAACAAKSYPSFFSEYLALA